MIYINIAYLRVSSSTQNIIPQKDLFEKYNIEKYFQEKVSGRTMERKALIEMMEFAREGDKIFILDFSRISRSLKDLLEIIDCFEKKKVTIISLKENLDTSTATGKMMLGIIGSINEFQVNIQREKQKVGIEYAKTIGKYKGRKKINFPDKWDEVYNQYKVREITAVKAMELLKLKKNTFYNLKKEWDNKLNN